MCNFLSWLECEGKTYVITDAEVKSEKGKELIKESGSTQDIWGHGFCRRFYGLTNAQGVEKEVANVWGKEILNKEIKALVKNLNRNFGYMFSLGGYLDLSILTSLPKNVQFPEKISGSLDLRSLTSLPKNVQFPEKISVSLYLNSLTSLPKNVQFPEKISGSLDLRSLTSLPKNVQFPKECGYLDLNSLTSLPKNVQFPKECGYLYLPKKLREMYDHR